jgi:hypothetical protein
MKPLVPLLVLVSATLVSFGSIPKSRPLQESFADFQKAYPARCDELLAEVRSRLIPTKNKQIAERFEHLERYRDNLRADIIEAQHSFTVPKDPAVLPFILHKICTDLVGFRRSLDALIIEASASKALIVDEVLLRKVRDFWEEEYGFSWRFGSEISPRPPGR